MSTQDSPITNPSHLPPEQLIEAEQGARRAGFKACLPALPGVFAWGMVVGVAMVKTNLTIMQALGMTFLTFAGSAQLAALPLIELGTPVWVIFFTCLIVNLRFVIFSAVLAPHFTYLSLRERTLWSYLTSDLPIVLFMQRYPTERPEAGKLDYLKGLIIPTWIAWQIGSIIGIFLGSKIPDEWGIGYAGALAILCILLPMVMNRAILVGVVVAGIVALLAADLPYKLGMLLGVVIGMICSMAWEECLGKQLKNKEKP